LDIEPIVLGFLANSKRDDGFEENWQCPKEWWCPKDWVMTVCTTLQAFFLALFSKSRLALPRFYNS
jgi:hypothetical protein